MGNVISGSKHMPLAQSDASGNMGYFLSFDYKYQDDNPVGTIEYSNLIFSGPGSWDEYSEGDTYPYELMFSVVMDKRDLYNI